MGSFLCLSCILLGLSCQKILPKIHPPKRHKKDTMAGCIEMESSIVGF